MAASLSCDDIRAKFAAITNAEGVAELLGVSYKALRYRLYGEPKSARYHTFEVPKKSGGVRVITAPSQHWKFLQRRLLHVLECVFEPKATVHGFTADRNIRTNATPHIRRRHVLNVDLNDFFPSINLGRVRGMFMSPPYNCPDKVATVLAQICCFNNELPQGAPTSPIVSNMICARMDAHLGRLARELRCYYTRYADDITFSTDGRDFPRDLAGVKVVDGESVCEIGRRLRQVIRRNGFQVNTKKVRLGFA